MKYFLILVTLFSCSPETKEDRPKDKIDNKPTIEATITRAEKIHLSSRGKSYLYYKIIFNNNTDTSFSGIKGKFSFYDKFGDTIHTVYIKNEIKIPAKDTASMLAVDEFISSSNIVERYVDQPDSIFKYKWALIQTIK